MAIGLTLLAGIVALPIALGAWIFGLVSFGGALLIYVGTGWSVLAAGMLSTLLANIFSRPADGTDEGAALVIKTADRG